VKALQVASLKAKEDAEKEEVRAATAVSNRSSINTADLEEEFMGARDRR